uniref:Uncharacterized protein n=1 Tax=Stomoxys calcitrans TaxID=35570 RepID=A0A1I8P1F2_STOCA
MLYKIFAVLSILCWLTLIRSANRRYDLRLYEFTCKSITNRLLLLECSFQNFETTNYYSLQSKFMFDRDMSDTLEVRVWVYIKLANSKNGIQFLDIRLKMCDILENALQNPLAKKIFAEFRRTSNIPAMCPFKANFLYQMNNFTVNDKYAPTYAPLLNFTVGYDLYEKTQLFATVKTIGALIAKTS